VNFTAPFLLNVMTALTWAIRLIIFFISGGVRHPEHRYRYPALILGAFLGGATGYRSAGIFAAAQ
jgi:hypothetical protein